MSVYPRSEANYVKEAPIDKFIVDFVKKKTAESVNLHLTSGVSIKHTNKKGSISLAILWANVLEHPNNFPNTHFSYKKLHDKTTGADKLILKAEDVTFTVWMGTGTLFMQGKYVYDWFQSRFREVLANADEEFVQNYVYEPSPVVHLEVDAEKYAPLGDPNTRTEDYMLMRNTEFSDYKETLPYFAKLEEGAEDLVEIMGNLNIDQSLFKGDALSEELSSLTTGRVKDGFNYIYPLWKSVLHKWFGTEGYKIYLASPFLDYQRLRDIINIFLSHRGPSGKLETFYVREKCDGHHGEGQISATAVKREALHHEDDDSEVYSSKDKPYIEYQLFRRMVYPMRRFHCKFVAGVKDGQAEVLVTSANFHGNHFATHNMETVFYAEMSEADFQEQYILPIASPVVATT